MMLSKKEALADEKDCADMLGMSVEEYREYVNTVKIPVKQPNTEKKRDNSILVKLGLSMEDLKKRKEL